MTDQPTVSVFVKLKFWDTYRLNSVLTAIVLRKILYVWGFMAFIWSALITFMILRPEPHRDWFVIMHDASPVRWVLAFPLLFIFVLPLLSARRVLRQPIVKEGVRYEFSEAGVHIETSVSQSDFSWQAILRTKETSSMFMIFTNPNSAFALPKWCFENAQDMYVLRKLLRDHVQNSHLNID